MLDVTGEAAGRAEAIRERIEAPELAALLLAKTTVAAERGVQLVADLDPDRLLISRSIRR